MADNDLFDSSTDDQSDPLFSDQSAQSSDKDFVSELVGEGKKFKDVQALAASVLHKEMHIHKIENENAELRQRVKQGLSLEEFYDKIKTSKPDPSPSSPAVGEQEQKPEISVEQVKALVGDTLKEHQTVEQSKANLNFAINEAKKVYGDSYKKILRDRAREIGETEQELTQLAMKKPHLFVELMVRPQKTVDTPSLPRTQIDTSKMGLTAGSGVRNMSWYSKLKAADPAKYKSREVQVQMHNDALALGEKFFQ
jgi:hypothetical protein